MIKITLANESHLDELARLFNLYRIFYEQKDDLDRAYDFIKARLVNQQSIVFVAEDDPDQLSGFVQLYPSFCSVSTIPILILYDLYVDQNHRGKGIGRLLMNQASKHAKDNGFKRLELSTAITNVIGQSLYESLNYQRDKDFYHYALELDD
ncbi:MAG: GNAT family N-acetyltransferase [Candidatus Thioglobus sp.]|jgi:ribosomal protein S18 acetylase RimI-like enzyme|nr:GNAT family N-acetyltransferase [Candidatus Nitrosopelagicus sp.]MCS5590530.1 GNAT family N-acetyltransferase [Candidatus Thioglobus sp.]|tara:strand:- start:2323 stop:2775 length:453 start_codon:yes stop_codon:yes gene_type:complete